MSQSKVRALFLFSLFTLAVMVTPAYSITITTYSDLAGWTAATTGITTDNFEGLAPTGTFTTTGAIFQNGVQFVGLAGSTGIADTTIFPWDNFNTGLAGFVTNSQNPINITITLPTPVTAFSLNLFTNPAAATYTVTTLSTPFTVPTFAVPTTAFFGATSDTPALHRKPVCSRGNHLRVLRQFLFRNARRRVRRTPARSRKPAHSS